MKQDERTPFHEALARARVAAFEPGEYVGQESFMRASEILALADKAGIGHGVSVLDLCCGVAGPGRLITAELGCTYLGVDSSPSAVEIARRRTEDLPCRFEVSEVPPLPEGQYDVVMLLETILAFRDKGSLVRDIADALPVGGRFACTIEEGSPLTPAEAATRPDADTVWLVPLDELTACLERAGLEVRWVRECTDAHRRTTDALIDAFSADREAIASHVGERAVDELIDAHRLWSDWLARGRVRKFALVAEKTGSSYRYR